MNELTKKTVETTGDLVKHIDFLPPFRQIKKYTESQNLGQNYKGVPRYLSTDDKGNNTGVGYAFEDLTIRCWRQQGKKVNMVDPVLNGADAIVNGEPCQLKCGTNGRNSASHLYEQPYGPYKYKGQTAVVPKGQGAAAMKTVKIRKNMLLGGPEKVIESPVTRQNAEAYCRKGWDSFKMDFTDPHIYKPCIGFGAVVAVGGAAIDFYINRKSLTKKKAIKKGLKWVAIGSLMTFVTIVGGCSYRQTLRPI